MVRSFTAALGAVLLLGSVGIASAQTVQRYNGVELSPSNEKYCYMPGSPCDNEHRVTNSLSAAMVEGRRRLLEKLKAEGKPVPGGAKGAA